MKNKPFGLIFFCFVFIIVGCSVNNETKNFLSGSDCQPPCLYGIVPGKSNIDNIKSGISSIPNVHDIVWIGKWSTYSDLLYFKFQNSGQEGEVSFINHIVDHILLYQKLNLTTGQIFALYGEPKSIFISDQKSGSSRVHRVNLLYPQKGIILSYDINPYLKSIQITQNINIEYVILLEPDLFDQFIFTSPLIGQVSEKFFYQHVIKWEGFTFYKIEE